MKPLLVIVIIFKGLFVKWFPSTVLVLASALLSTGCSNMMFYPTEQWQRTPDQLGLNYRDLVIESEDGTRLSAWWLEAIGEAKGTVLFLHGNSGNISTNLGSVYWLPERGYQVLMLDYRGYGRSQGSPALPEVFGDIEAALYWLQRAPAAHDKPLFLLAQSLGASMGGYLVSSRPELGGQFAAVVLDAGFTRYSDIARDIASRHWTTWLFQYPVAWSMPNDYDLVDYIHNLSPTPLLLIHGTEDEVVPFFFSEELFASASKPKSFLRYDGPHIGTFLDLENRELLLGFFKTALERKAAESDSSRP